MKNRVKVSKQLKSSKPYARNHDTKNKKSHNTNQRQKHVSLVEELDNVDINQLNVQVIEEIKANEKAKLEEKKKRVELRKQDFKKKALEYEKYQDDMDKALELMEGITKF